MEIVTSLEQLIEILKEYADEDGNIHVTSSPIEREDGIVPHTPKSTTDWFDMLKTLPDSKLKSMGMGHWTDNHWLFPIEWYDFIPIGYMVTDIFDETFPFDHAFDKDVRFGCIACGIIVNSNRKSEMEKSNV